ncbi:hypothetical protein SynBIOSE41_02980 [Synechococcus sp. BIOS-E4-1]|nr:hypothetical protein SynBIOSE41_02980 [Synechococcus sp. BIOS-E4-1]
MLVSLLFNNIETVKNALVCQINSGLMSHRVLMAVQALHLLTDSVCQ